MNINIKGEAFMQIVWMEDDFRNLTAKVWANLDNPIKRYDFSKVSLILCMSPSQVALFQYRDVITVQLSNGAVHKFVQNFTFMKMHLPSSFILRYVRSEMIVHVFMIELDQKDYWYPRKFEIVKNLCAKSMESCPRVISHILAEFNPERATYATLYNHFS